MKEVSLNILDIVQNSIPANARKIEIGIEEAKKSNFMRIVINDDVSGISPELLPNVTDPFTTSRTKRKVGMGLAFFRQHAEMSGFVIGMYGNHDFIALLRFSINYCF